VLRHSRCDVLTVPPRTPSSGGHVSDSTIVCGVDFSESGAEFCPQARRIARVAFELAEGVHARVLLVHVIDWPGHVEMADEVDFNVSDFRARLVYNDQQRLDALVAGEGPVSPVVRTKIAIAVRAASWFALPATSRRR
jgi:nucleotide-binding universal stress UspA family protein